MIDRREGPPAGDDVNPSPALSELAEEITRRLQSGETIDLDAYPGLHPDSAGSIRALLPTMYDLVDLGQSVARDRRHFPLPPRKAPRS
ncbi:MAG: hypothetical protein P4L84_05485 [Isosphaeraceae bacterium]|nr:hypothetical protein [Isosphaeraceae bacterium]